MQPIQSTHADLWGMIGKSFSRSAIALSERLRQSVLHTILKQLLQLVSKLLETSIIGVELKFLVVRARDGQSRSIAVNTQFDVECLADAILRNPNAALSLSWVDPTATLIRPQASSVIVTSFMSISDDTIIGQIQLRRKGESATGTLRWHVAPNLSLL
jgi:hypothetical protein